MKLGRHGVGALIFSVKGKFCIPVIQNLRSRDNFPRKVSTASIRRQCMVRGRRPFCQRLRFRKKKLADMMWIISRMDFQLLIFCTEDF